MGVFVAFGIHATYGQSARPDTIEQEARVRWVEKCMGDFEKIKLGMTRSDVDKIFPHDGGIQRPSPVRYVHPECFYFMVDVSYDVKKNPQDQFRPTPTQNDPVTNISRPYLAHPAYD